MLWQLNNRGSLIQALQRNLLLFPVEAHMVLSDATSRVERGLASWPVLNPSSQLLTVMSWVYMHISPLSKALITEVSAEAVPSLPVSSDPMITFPAIV